ncbi:MAG: hypothetical protein CVU41_12550 [Chloroflexi bacterium HGW-Chloroflexi-3]|nr:MAG: hypothetical protein CVU41_12550 [Chloroflexi bacterium HGW-Chloroflexi-3]
MIAIVSFIHQPDTDKAILYNQKTLELFVRSIREGFRSGSKGVAQDDILINKGWGFDLSKIIPRIDIWHGEKDVNVPIGAARYLRDTLPYARTTFLAGEGHFFIMKYWKKYFQHLL